MCSTTNKKKLKTCARNTLHCIVLSHMHIQWSKLDADDASEMFISSSRTAMTLLVEELQISHRAMQLSLGAIQLSLGAMQLSNWKKRRENIKHMREVWIDSMLYFLQTSRSHPSPCWHRLCDERVDLHPGQEAKHMHRLMRCVIVLYFRFRWYATVMLLVIRHGTRHEVSGVLGRKKTYWNFAVFTLIGQCFKLT